MAYYHADNHCGGNSLAGVLTSRFYWPNIRYAVDPTLERDCKDCSDFVKGCHMCAIFRAQKNPETKLGNTSDYIPRIKAYCWSIDILEGFPTFGPYNGQVLAVAEHYTHFRILKPLKKSKATEIANILEDVITTFAPSLFISDRGTNLLMSQQVKDLFAKYQIKGHVTVPYSGKSHGMIEALHKSVSALIRICVEEQQTANWPSLLPYIQLTLNQKKLCYFDNYSPFELMFGMEPVRNRHDTPKESELFQSPDDTMAAWQQTNKAIQATIEKHFNKLQKQYNALTLRPRSFPVGSFVYLRDLRPNVPKKKIKARYFQQPLLVMDERPQTLMVKTFDGRLLKIHKDHCKQAHPRGERAFGSLPTRVKMSL